jgi:hypothetical protein
MQDQPVSYQDVVAWIRESLADYQGLYDVQDLTFVRSAVRVVTPRRDARYDVERGRWPELADPQGRPTLTAELQRWARQHLGGHG